MLKNDFHAAEKLAAENDEAALGALRSACAKKQTRAAYIGLAALLHIVFGQWLVQKAAPSLIADHEYEYGLVYALVSAVGLLLYFSLSKRYSEKGQLAELALELKRRGPIAGSAPRTE